MEQRKRKTLEKHHTAWKKRTSSRSILECDAMPVPALSNLSPRRRRPARDRASSSRHSSLKKCRPSANSLVLSSPDRPQPADKASRLAECENDPPDEWQDRRRKPWTAVPSQIISHPICEGLFTSPGMAPAPNGDLRAAVACVHGGLTTFCSGVPGDHARAKPAQGASRPRDLFQSSQQLLPSARRKLVNDPARYRSTDPWHLSYTPKSAVFA
ncbi:hypothetical protein ACVJBD_007408 [Rhizobium mongolense]